MVHAGELVKELDALVQAAYQAHEPGAAVIVVKDGQPLYRKGIGLANMELSVPIEPTMVFRLGSITKQITAVAILMLVEQGRLQLSDPIIRFLPEYPTQGRTITVEHLLTHTSGIHNYTNMPEWSAVWRKDFTVAELIDFFSSQPLRFEPGMRMEYSNSGYHLLGAIIEQASGQSYEQFLQQRVFEPLGMHDTSYDHTRRIIPRRVAGYDKRSEGYQNAEYLSMTQPYAAGGLVSNVDDLARWDAALTAGTLLAPETLQRAWTPFKLTDGKASNYGYGWGIGTWQGSATVEHGGGIHGFLTYAIRIPDEHVFVAVLSNNTGAPHIELLALRMAGLALGRPYVPPASIEVEPDRLDQYVGVYPLEQDQNWTMTREGDKLIALRSGWSPLSLLPIEPDTFCIDDMPLLRFIFTPIANGGMRVEVHDRSGPQETATRNE